MLWHSGSDAKIESLHFFTQEHNTAQALENQALWIHGELEQEKDAS